MSSRRISKVFVVGGTHGNERSGIHLAQMFQEKASLSDRWPSLRVHGLVSNTESTKTNTRYVQEDMNRCFTMAKLSEKPPKTLEQNRAQELNLLLGPKGSSSPNADFIFDLHNSTSNTGMMLCFDQRDKLARELGAHLNRLDDQVRLVHWQNLDDQPFLPSVGKSGMTIEMGPVAHGTVDARQMERVRRLLWNGLEYLHRLNVEEEGSPSIPRVNHLVSIAERISILDYPRSENGQAVAFIHAGLQGIPELQEGSHLTPGTPLFSSVDGETVVKFNPKSHGLDPGKEYFPIFVNEAAYFEKNTAMMICERLDGIQVSVLQVPDTQKSTVNTASSKL